MYGVEAGCGGGGTGGFGESGGFGWPECLGESGCLGRFGRFGRGRQGAGGASGSGAVRGAAPGSLGPGVFDESRVFRIDHFLGKESVDNILALRFANGLLEPVWNRDHISHVQIDVPEHIDIQGRAHFFEGTGTFRDMIVTHLFQLLGFVAMEPPATLDAKSLRAEKDKVFQSLRPLDPARVVRGQYDGYRDEPGVDPASDTETLAALRLEIDNWRWAGVPFYLRSGKALAESRHVITLGFREPPLRMFPLAAQESADGRHNELVIDFDDPGTITARFLAKQPGPDMRLAQAEMVFDYAGSFAQDHALEGYERLILDAMLGD
ncbi:hypothetical protein ACWCQ0_46370, partial [Streptomyces massasporeus]